MERDFISIFIFALGTAGSIYIFKSIFDFVIKRNFFETFLKIFKRNGAATPGHLRIPEIYEMARVLADYIENLGIEERK